MLFDYAGKTYRTQRELYVAMYAARESKGRTTRELAEEIMLQEFGHSPKSKDAFVGKRLLEIVSAIDGKRYEEYPCYIPARALKGFEDRVKTTNALLKGDKSEWAKGTKSGAKRALDFARRLHLGQDISEALADSMKYIEPKD